MVIYPERDMAIKLARSLVSRNFLEQISLSKEYGIIELFAPQAYVNKITIIITMFLGRVGPLSLVFALAYR